MIEAREQDLTVTNRGYAEPFWRGEKLFNYVQYLEQVLKSEQSLAVMMSQNLSMIRKEKTHSDREVQKLNQKYQLMNEEHMAALSKLSSAYKRIEHDREERRELLDHIGEADQRTQNAEQRTDHFQRLLEDQNTQIRVLEAQILHKSNTLTLIPNPNRTRQRTEAQEDTEGVFHDHVVEVSYSNKVEAPRARTVRIAERGRKLSETVVLNEEPIYIAETPRAPSVERFEGTVGCGDGVSTRNVSPRMNQHLSFSNT